MYGPRPPSLPPKPGSHETSQIDTPAASTSPQHGAQAGPVGDGVMNREEAATQPAGLECARPGPISDPGDQWLPDVVLCKSKQDLADITTNPNILNALTHAPGIIHPSLLQSQRGLQIALAENLDYAFRLVELEGRASVETKAGGHGSRS
ncbi:hypothetical protein Cob_v004114 [Colletotrichum orbiculare MAFF 240422]|uniref:Uncharacterized protein n=1 Tax=Colletotrichum orbiculare (strain 104-T / ATCC 96160 / CBS 514.97 / LARS 414 / MAFF 240422) TaxID=1213857 RepID=A0A484G0K4_COLOR|nr:hypothetical protein Cob_v004114 [Colletotrichum orbiculare MAFF 240422]